MKADPSGKADTRQGNASMADPSGKAIMRKMPRWTKGESQREKKIKIKATEEDTEINCLEWAEHGTETNGFTNHDKEQMIWAIVKSIMDTGAATSVSPPALACHMPFAPTPASQKGAEFQTADGGKIVNQGRRTIPSFTHAGEAVNMKYDVADVIKPLNSVTQICDEGNQVLFTKNGGCIWNETTGHVVEFSRERGVYVLETWTHLPQSTVNEMGFMRRVP